MAETLKELRDKAVMYISMIDDSENGRIALIDTIEQYNDIRDKIGNMFEKGERPETIIWSFFPREKFYFLELALEGDEIEYYVFKRKT